MKIEVDAQAFAVVLDAAKDRVADLRTGIEEGVLPREATEHDIAELQAAIETLQ